MSDRRVTRLWRVAGVLALGLAGWFASAPSHAMVELTGISKIAAGGGHTCALTTGGGVKCWGDNVSGQLGDNTITPRFTPVDVSGLASGVTAITAGSLHTCALTTGGGVKCWGFNAFGELGDNTTAQQRLTPVDVSGLASGVAAITAGYTHTCALTTAGGVKCWGNNQFGQLGDNTTTRRLAPVGVSGLASGVAAITAGQDYTCALTTAGGVKCWGDNSYGQLGDNSTTQRLTPVDVLGLASGVAATTAGSYNTCARTTGGGVKCWGDNSYGQLGDNSTTQRLTPVDVSGLASGVAAISAAGGYGRSTTYGAAGGFHTCALTTGGGVKCWGWNIYGQLGDNSTTQRSTPVDVSGLASGVVVITSGSNHTCALTTAGGVKCWGYNGEGQLGDNSTTSYRLTPVDVSGLASGVAAITAGSLHTCGLTTGGGVKCWGYNSDGELGDNNSPTLHLTPIDALGLASGVAAIAAGGYHTCALTTGGGVKCWGWNIYGQLGDNSITQRSTPVDVSGLASGVVVITSGSNHTCARTAIGGVKCWGNNAYGQLGDNTLANRLTPVDVSGLASGVAAITAGGFHTCALTTAGGVKCWGYNGDGELGDNTTTDRLTQVDVAGLANGVAAITAGRYHTCALTTAGGVKCWGYNGYGQLGDNSTTSRLTPVDVSGLASGVAAIKAGSYHTCALTRAGGVKCWGNNGNGQLGDNTFDYRLMPVDVSGLASGVVAIAAGTFHTCVLTTAGGVKCWGYNVDGQLGDGTVAIRAIPAPVLVPQTPQCTLTASPGTITVGGSATLTATCSPAATSYAWTPAPGLVAGPANTATVTPAAVGVYQYSVTGSNADGAGNTASTSVTVTVPAFTSQSDCLFNWAERTFPSLFAPPSAISNMLAQYYYRYYPSTNAYLATSSVDFHVYYLGPLSNNSILDVGAISPLLSTAGCQ